MSTSSLGLAASVASPVGEAFMPCAKACFFFRLPLSLRERGPGREVKSQAAPPFSFRIRLSPPSGCPTPPIEFIFIYRHQLTLPGRLSLSVSVRRLVVKRRSIRHDIQCTARFFP